MSPPPSRSALREKYDRKQQAVIEASARTFAERGYHNTSMTDLMEATGLRSGGLYHYIGSKEKLLFMIFESVMGSILEDVSEIVELDAPPEERFRLLLRVWMRHIERRREHMIVLQQEWYFFRTEQNWRKIRQGRKDFEKMVARLLAEIADGEGSEGSDSDKTHIALMALMGMVNYTSQWYRARGRLGAEEIADGYCDIILASLRERTGNGWQDDRTTVMAP